MKVIDIKDFDSWFGKIVFAPNASGKSRVAANLYDYFHEEKGQSVQLFSSKTIAELVSVSKEDIFIGKTSINKLENKNIVENLDDNKNFKKTINDKYSETSAKGLKEKSAFFSSLNLTNLNLKSFFQKEIFDYDDNSKSKLSDEEIFSIDQEIKYDIILEIKNNLLNLEDNEVDDNYNDSSELTEEQIEMFNKVLNLTKQKRYINCPSCGKEFTSNEELIDSMTRNLNRFIINNDINKKKIINEIWQKIISNKNTSLSKYISLNEEQISAKLVNILEYYELYRQTNNQIKKYLLSLDYGVENFSSLKEVKAKYDSNNELIIQEKNSIINDESFSNCIIKEFSNLVLLPEKLELTFSDDKLNVIVDGEVKNVNDVLSESEIKRLALAVLKSILINTNIDKVILDDPIDSYDSYYMNIACGYISDLVNKFNVEWLILTHMYDLILNLSLNNISKLQYVMYLYDPNYKINNDDDMVKRPDLIKFIVEDIEDIEFLNQNEILIIQKILESGRKSKNDKIFSMVAMFPILRSSVKEINSLILINYKNSKIKKSIEELEKNFLHYSLCDEKTKKIIDLNKKYFLNFKKCSNNYENSLIKLRENYLNEKFKDIKINNFLVKYIMFMMLRISNSKYMFEKEIYKLLVNEKVDIGTIDLYLRTNKLGAKIRIIESKLSEDKKNQITRIYSSYTALINVYSHSLTKMFPPYLTTNIRDVALLEYDISKINIENEPSL